MGTCVWTLTHKYYSKCWTLSINITQVHSTSIKKKIELGYVPLSPCAIVYCCAHASALTRKPHDRVVPTKGHLPLEIPPWQLQQESLNVSSCWKHLLWKSAAGQKDTTQRPPQLDHTALTTHPPIQVNRTSLIKKTWHKSRAYLS